MAYRRAILVSEKIFVIYDLVIKFKLFFVLIFYENGYVV
jgi:hypothetical protein